MSKLLVFKHDLFGILRVTVVDERTYFVGIDVERALRCNKSGELIGKWVRPEYKIILDINTGNGIQSLTLITQEGVEALMARVPVMATRIFGDWVASDVLPTVYDTFYCSDCYINQTYNRPIPVDCNESTIAITDIQPNVKENKNGENGYSVFENDEFGTIRTVMINGTPYFVGKDVAEALGYSNSSKAVATHIDEEDKRFVMLDIVDAQNGNVPIGQSKTAVINESGLYSLIMRSKLPTAKKFKRWVTSDVLPSIRKYGSYSITSNTENARQTDLNSGTISQLVSVLQIEQEENKRLQKMVESLINIIRG
jgi:prophage antirepressor-like protein